ncbi:hypothetical protein FJT64_004853 [Amphibalanus amphitrite]|uniref:Uncharacterized protein n=1 Tax=Amphibalanus amphitrite TaxID=1232801 RepID=A0A6A4W6U1_AMPAM|nr:hypothetical protein FJT64_004853 [Amphibalanus amphitrite]
MSLRDSCPSYVTSHLDQPSGCRRRWVARSAAAGRPPAVAAWTCAPAAWSIASAIIVLEIVGSVGAVVGLHLMGGGLTLAEELDGELEQPAGGGGGTGTAWVPLLPDEPAWVPQQPPPDTELLRELELESELELELESGLESELESVATAGGSPLQWAAQDSTVLRLQQPIDDIVFTGGGGAAAAPVRRPGGGVGAAGGAAGVGSRVPSRELAALARYQRRALLVASCALVVVTLACNVSLARAAAPEPAQSEPRHRALSGLLTAASFFVVVFYWYCFVVVLSFHMQLRSERPAKAAAESAA